MNDVNRYAEKEIQAMFEGKQGNLSCVPVGALVPIKGKLAVALERWEENPEKVKDTRTRWLHQCLYRVEGGGHVLHNFIQHKMDSKQFSHSYAEVTYAGAAYWLKRHGYPEPPRPDYERPETLSEAMARHGPVRSIGAL